MITCDSCSREFTAKGQSKYCPYCGYNNGTGWWARQQDAPQPRPRQTKHAQVKLSQLRATQRRMTDRQKASKEGRRFCAFYRGCRDALADNTGNPYPIGSDEAECWDKGRQFAEDEQ